MLKLDPADLQYSNNCCEWTSRVIIMCLNKINGLKRSQSNMIYKNTTTTAIIFCKWWEMNTYHMWYKHWYGTDAYLMSIDKCYYEMDKRGYLAMNFSIDRK